ncbi:conserved hypothetical protein [Ricinus communis]|uniref:Uncharacterized protein n=1 Tax=Ricinus communis TaxID=3988 RepID=B9S4X7_RICCO|nr:conserved hypothetical protein [Ricinus communis]
MTCSKCNKKSHNKKGCKATRVQPAANTVNKATDSTSKATKKPTNVASLAMLFNTASSQNTNVPPT